MVVSTSESQSEEGRMDLLDERVVALSRSQGQGTEGMCFHSVLAGTQPDSKRLRRDTRIRTETSVGPRVTIRLDPVLRWVFLRCIVDHTFLQCMRCELGPNLELKVDRAYPPWLRVWCAREAEGCEDEVKFSTPPCSPVRRPCFFAFIFVSGTLMGNICRKRASQFQSQRTGSSGGATALNVAHSCSTVCGGPTSFSSLCLSVL